MKIIKLTMKAFGSYGSETTLDYADLQNGLYLIRGKTGAGKTTIFDAVMIALYGVASGERRDFAMFHSDFVPKSVDSEVELVFEHQGGTHRVRRVQHFRHTRGTDEYVAESPGATFWEAGKPVIERASAVTKRITELIGLTAAQFRQIVMLAQGDFRKFLDAKSDERGAILRQIFDTSDYRGVTERLCTAYGRLKEARDDEKKSISVLVENMTVPADVTEDEKAKLNADHPELLPALEGLVTRETASAEALAAVAKKTADELTSLTEAHASAKIRNDQLRDLKAARDKMAVLEGRKGEMAARESVKDTALRALPAKRAMEAATSRAEEVAEKEGVLAAEQARLDDLQLKKAAAEEERQALGYDEESVARLDRDLAQLRPLLDVFRKLEDGQREKAKLEQDVQRAEQRRRGLAAAFDAAKNELEGLNAQCEGLGNPEQEKTGAEAEVNDCEHRLRNIETLLRNVSDVERSIAERKANLIAQARKILDRDALTWEELALGEGIRAAQGETEGRKASAMIAVAMADDKVQRKKKLLGEIRKVEDARDEADKAMKAELPQYDALVSSLGKLDGAIGTLKARVDGRGTQNQFEADLNEKQRERDRMDAIVKAAAGKVADATAEFNSQAGVVKGLRSALEDLRKTAEVSKAGLAACLEERGYADVPALEVDLAKLPAGVDETWLADETKALGVYQSDWKTTGEKITKLSQETEGCVEVDLEALAADIGEIRGKSEKDADAANRAKNLLEGHLRLLAKLRASAAKLAQTATGFRRLGELVGMVNGAQGQGADRLDFERYMLGDNLREVLAMANQRLDIMSGGRYELVHRIEGLNRQGSAGLDIDVLDHMTGARRQAGSFSGGEGFQASMALALGLSDVVKNHAGSAGLDSTFIDEGFGSLDGDVLENCIRVLKDLAGGRRQVGIISHVEKLEEDIWPQIVVEGGATGSTARIEKR